VHCTDKKLLLGFGIKIFSFFITHHNLRLDLQLSHPHPFLHSLTLAGFTSIS
jgi:hypothetical protein